KIARGFESSVFSIRQRVSTSAAFASPSAEKSKRIPRLQAAKITRSFARNDRFGLHRNTSLFCGEVRFGVGERIHSRANAGACSNRRALVEQDFFHFAERNHNTYFLTVKAPQSV